MSVEGNMRTLRELINVICSTSVKVQGHVEPVEISSLLSNEPEAYNEIASIKDSAKALNLLIEDLKCAQE